MKDFLISLKNDLVQASIPLMAAIVGVLVYVFQARGRALHKAQVELLASRYKDARERNDATVKAAQDAYIKALAEYRKSK